MDLVLKLREIRRLRGLSQKDVSRLSGVGEKTISSFETGQRIGSLKLAQLKRLLKVYGLSEAEFFGGVVEKEIAPWELNEEEFATSRLLDDLRALPRNTRKAMLHKFAVMLEGIDSPAPREPRTKPHAYVYDSPEWQMLTSRN